MNEQKLLERITVNPAIFSGKPIIRGLRVAVEQILGMLAAGDSGGDILEFYIRPANARPSTAVSSCPAPAAV
jgi:uncharacterized protein (DUF433 family)